jgi:hypothetical protein
MTASSSVLSSGRKGHWAFPACPSAPNGLELASTSRAGAPPEPRSIFRGKLPFAWNVSYFDVAGETYWKSAEYSMREAIAMMLEYQVDMLLPALFTLQASEREAGNQGALTR